MHQAIFKKISYDGRGSYLQVYIPGVNIKDDLFINNGFANGLVKVDDDRSITAKQRSLIYALFRDVSDHTGQPEKDVKELMKEEFSVMMNIPKFSLSNIRQTIASDFIEYILEATFILGVPLKRDSMQLSKSYQRWAYLCFEHRECVVCRKGNAHVHHMDAVGRRNRNKVDHSKMLLMMLCPHHHAETHTIGDETFCKRYHVAGIYVPVATLKRLNIKGQYGEEANI